MNKLCRSSRGSWQQHPIDWGPVVKIWVDQSSISSKAKGGAIWPECHQLRELTLPFPRGKKQTAVIHFSKFFIKLITLLTVRQCVRILFFAGIFTCKEFDVYRELS